MDISPKRYPMANAVNHEFFDHINTQEKAYCLGLICADGYLVSNRPRIGIDLHPKDEDILYKVASAIDFSGNIINGTKTPSYYAKRLLWTSNRMWLKLHEYGIDSQKSYTLRPLQTEIPSNLFNHFYRGYFDGDGSWTFSYEGSKGTTSYRRKLAINIRSTSLFCEYLNTNCPIKLNYRFDITGILKSNKQQTVIDFGNWLYKDATIYLNRKYIRFIEKTR